MIWFYKGITTMPWHRKMTPCGLTPATCPPTATAASSGSSRKKYAKALADYDEALRLDPIMSTPATTARWLFATCADAKVPRSR